MMGFVMLLIGTLVVTIVVSILLFRVCRHTGIARSTKTHVFSLLISGLIFFVVSVFLYYSTL